MAKSEDLGRVASVRDDGDESNLDYAHEHFRRELDLTFENHGMTHRAGDAESPS